MNFPVFEKCIKTLPGDHLEIQLLWIECKKNTKDFLKALSGKTYKKTRAKILLDWPVLVNSENLKLVIGGKAFQTIPQKIRDVLDRHVPDECVEYLNKQRWVLREIDNEEVLHFVYSGLPKSEKIFFNKKNKKAILRRVKNKKQIGLAEEAYSLGLAPPVLLKRSDCYLVAEEESPKEYTKKIIFSVLDGLLNLLKNGIKLGKNRPRLSDVSIGPDETILFTNFSDADTVSKEDIEEEMGEYFFTIGIHLSISGVFTDLLRGSKEPDAPLLFLSEWARKKGGDINEVIQDRVDYYQERLKKEYIPVFWN